PPPKGVRQRGRLPFETGALLLASLPRGGHAPAFCPPLPDAVHAWAWSFFRTLPGIGDGSGEAGGMPCGCTSLKEPPSSPGEEKEKRLPEIRQPPAVSITVPREDGVCRLPQPVGALLGELLHLRHTVGVIVLNPGQL